MDTVTTNDIQLEGIFTFYLRSAGSAPGNRVELAVGVKHTIGAIYWGVKGKF